MFKVKDVWHASRQYMESLPLFCLMITIDERKLVLILQMLGGGWYIWSSKPKVAWGQENLGGEDCDEPDLNN